MLDLIRNQKVSGSTLPVGFFKKVPELGLLINDHTVFLTTW